MAKENKFYPRGFSLVLMLPNGNIQNVNIPKSKRGFGHEAVGGRMTYQMAIDSYTILFKDKNELLDDIRKNGYARIKRVRNKDINVATNYNGEFLSDVIVYSDSESLAHFISNSSIGGNFGFEGRDHRTVAYEVISEFKKQAINMYYNSEFSSYYQRYLKRIPSLRNMSLYDSLRIGYDAEEYKQSRRYFLLREEPFYYYENIRRHLLTDYKELEISFAQARYDDSPFNERVEARKDLEESLAEINQKYDKKDEPIKPLDGSSEEKFDFSKLPGPYTIDPEEQMEMLDHPSAQDIIDEETTTKLNRYYELSKLLDDAGYYNSDYNDESQEYGKYATEFESLADELDDVLSPYDYDNEYEEYLDSLVPESEIVPYEELGEFDYFEADDSFENHNGNFRKH